MSGHKSNEKPVLDRKTKMYIIIALVILVQIILSVILGTHLFRKNFDASKKNTENSITQWAYDTTYNATEKANHVSNEITLNFGDLRETADLEVLEAYSTHYYISSAEDNKAMEAWLEVPGHCVFTINMQMSEVIVDGNRHHVLIRIPSPVVSYSKLDVSDIKPYRVENKQLFPQILTGIQDGEKIAQDMLRESQQKVTENISSSADYYKSAKENAVKIIRTMVKNLNPDIPDLVIDIEFL